MSHAFGITIRDTNNGTLTVDKLPSSSAANQAGVSKGEIDKNTIDTGQTPDGGFVMAGGSGEGQDAIGLPLPSDNSELIVQTVPGSTVDGSA